ncbi:PAS domain S-box protein [Tautonia plasticadhaerens]|uniref:histidine kinase n=1 Tax=Tautonia plasticadhaerens TaxID=2527974 RepID=A0A518HBB2_9BACT|nr:PAS domain S-box protein [Tautonia plasticadhaerens]QDV38145.1 Sensory/regulatory protein RpfC [Tautonia plasticadhaerens]
MADFFTRLLDTSDFPGRWRCGNWTPGLGWLHVGSDLGIFGAYLSIPLVLAYFLIRRRDVPFPRIGWLFGAFILSCGIGHLIEAVIFWHPVYRLAGLVKAATAVVSWFTVVALIRVIPDALKLPDIARLNERLCREVVEREQVEQALRAREAEARKLALVASRTDNAVIITDADGVIEWVNDGFTRITEYPAEEAIGRRPGSFLQGPETDPGVVASMRDHRLRGEGFRAEVVNYSRSGRPYWLSLEVQPVRDDSGALTHFMAIESDITARKLAEREMGERARLAALSADIGLALTRGDALSERLDACCEAMVRHLDAAFARIWTLEPGDDSLVLRASAGLYTHLDGAHARVPLGALKIGRIARTGRPLLTNDVPNDPNVGDPSWARETGMVAFAGVPLLVEGRAVGVMALFSRSPIDQATIDALGPISNAVALGIVRESAARALFSSEGRKAAILRMALDAIITVDDRGRVLEFNPAAEAIFGYEAGEAAGRSLSELIIPPDLREAHERGMARFRENGDGAVVGRWIELRAVRRSGEEFPAELAITPITSGDRPVFTGYLRDITDRRLHEQSLRAAKEAAEEANRAKSRFLANMSHEIRTPLTAILGYAEVLMGDEVSREDRVEYLVTILSSGRHLRTLIDDILDLAKIENEKLDFELVPCSPHRILSEVLSVLRVAASEKGLRLGCRWESRVPEEIRTDPSRFRQLLVNLVGNAIKFTDLGGVRLVALLEPGERGPMFTVEVHDTGAGIAPEDLSRIFDPFEQADGSVTRRNGGTGLGLAISRHIARGLGGDLTVVSQLGVGSIFRASVAAGPAEGLRLLDAPPAEAVETPRADAAPTSRLSGKQLLVVDDGEENRRLVQLILSRAGASVACVANGEECLEAVARVDFDLIVLDMQMPVLDGYRTASLLRERGFGGPIIALTAHAMRGDDRRCLEAGCSGYLTKPIEIDRLLSTVSRAMDGPAVASPAPRPQSPGGGGGGPIVSTLPMDDPEIRGLVASYVDRLGAKVDEMGEALRRGDRKALSELAHWLKGSGGTAGFHELTEPATRLERLAPLGQESDLREAYGLVRSTAARVTAPEPILA